MTTSATVDYRPNVLAALDHTTKLRWEHGFDAYRLSDGDMAAGSTLGSPSCQLVLKATGAIEKVYCVDAGAVLLKTFVLKYWDERSGMKLDPTAGHFFMYPAHQEHRYLLSNGVYVREAVWVLSRGRCDDGSVDPPAVYYAISFTNDTDEEQSMATYAFAELAKDFKDDLAVQYDAELRALVAYSKNEPHLARTEELKKNYRACPRAEEALATTREHYRESLGRAVVFTPNDVINRGCMWAKANIERVLLKSSPTGWGFTNSPTQSTKCVGRDSAWFCAGADYFRPDFARACLLQFAQRQKDDGMIVEDYDMLDGKTQDFGLNINDDTPLFVWGVWHHYAMTRDRTFLDEILETVIKAGRYIASVRNEQGLVWCTSEEFGSKGIIGWRNVIQGYRLSGAVTEVNSECYAAFRCVAVLARAGGDGDTAREFEGFASQLHAAIEKHLTNPGNGLYYLNIDLDGTPRSDITADLVFPVLFDVASPERSAEIVRRLTDRDFWTPGGMRTVPHDAVNYSAKDSSGCLGGVWNGMTFWFAKAAAAYIPDFMDEALTNGYENYARDPQRNNTVPGQFSEWLHGETLVNEGMLLSPWFPPRYLWAAIEGALGLDLSGERPRVHPNMPSYWHWCALRNLPLRGKNVTWFVARSPELRAYTNGDIEADFPVDKFEEDISDRVRCSGDNAVSLGLASSDKMVALVGNTSDRTITTALRITDADGPYTVRRFDSLAQCWQDLAALDAAQLDAGITLMLAPHGFQLFELQQR